MSDSMRPRPDDYVPPCMDVNNPGPHVATHVRCGRCGRIETMPVNSSHWEASAPLKEAVKPEPNMDEIAKAHAGTWWRSQEMFPDDEPSEGLVDAFRAAMTEYADALKEQK